MQPQWDGIANFDTLTREITMRRHRLGSIALTSAILLGAPTLAGCGDAIQQGAEQIAEGAVGGQVDITDEGVTIEGEGGEKATERVGRGCVGAKTAGGGMGIG